MQNGHCDASGAEVMGQRDARDIEGSLGHAISEAHPGGVVCDGPHSTGHHGNLGALVKIGEQRVSQTEGPHSIHFKLFEDLRIIHIVEGLSLEDPGVVNEEFKGLPLKALDEGADALGDGNINTSLYSKVQGA